VRERVSVEEGEGKITNRSTGSDEVSNASKKLPSEVDQIQAFKGEQEEIYPNFEFP
jgi:hypothetical protein